MPTHHSTLDMASTKQIADELKKLLDAPSLPDISKQLTELKISLTKLGRSPQELDTARDSLEVACLLSVKAKDEMGFERFFAQLRPYYFDFGLNESSRESLLQGLYLMCLLTQGKRADFHTQLELLPPKQRSSPMIKFPVDLERDMNEGLYNRVWNACNTLPDPAFGLFAERLGIAVRVDIAQCLQVAYEHLQVQDAMQLLRFTPQQTNAFQEFATHEDRAWNIDNGLVSFKHDLHDDLDLGAEPLINQALSYAHEIERII